MLSIHRSNSTLLLVDLQERVMPAIHNASQVIRNVQKLLSGARLLQVPCLFTEHNSRGLGGTISVLSQRPVPVIHKMSFDATRSPEFEKLPGSGAIIIAGCEAHVCVLQTVLGLLDLGRQVYVVEDAIASRDPQNKKTAVERMHRHGAEIVSTEMVLFEWLESAEHPHFREILALIK